eukprot:6468332-Amphidinium_carterae.3
MESTNTEVVPYWVRLPGLRNDKGVAVDLELKAWLHGAHSLHWELRRIYDGLNLVSRSNRYLHAWLWERKLLLESEFAQLGLRWEDHHRCSHKAERARKRKDKDDNSSIHEEFTVTTLGLLLFLQIMAVSLRNPQQKLAAQTILTNMFDRMGSHMSVQTALGAITQEQSLLCPSRLCGKVACVHLESMRAIDEQGNLVNGSIGIGWKSIMSLLPVCPAMKKGVSAVLAQLADQLVIGVLESSYTSDPLQGSRVSVNHPEVHLKRRRADEDYKEAVVTKVVTQGRAASGRAYVRAVEGPDACSKVSLWEDQHSTRYLLSGWAMPEHVSYSVAIDASRLGKPAEETLVAFAYARDCSAGVWLPPQVSNLTAFLSLTHPFQKESAICSDKRCLVRTSIKTFGQVLCCCLPVVQSCLYNVRTNMFLVRTSLSSGEQGSSRSVQVAINSFHE